MTQQTGAPADDGLALAIDMVENPHTYYADPVQVMQEAQVLVLIDIARSLRELAERAY
jgi:hypothetical protein